MSSFKVFVFALSVSVGLIVYFYYPKDAHIVLQEKAVTHVTEKIEKLEEKKNVIMQVIDNKNNSSKSENKDEEKKKKDAFPKNENKHEVKTKIDENSTRNPNIIIGYKENNKTKKAKPIQWLKSKVGGLWVKPLEEECTKGGGKNVYKGCEANWADAQEICKNLNSKVPSLDDFKRLIADCDKEVKEQKNVDRKSIRNLYNTCYKESGLLRGEYWTSTEKNEDSAYTFYYAMRDHFYYRDKKDYNEFICIKGDYTPTIEIETKRLNLRQWTSKDFRSFSELNEDHEVMEYSSSTFSEEKSYKLAQTMKDDISIDGWGLWVMEEKKSGKFVGFAGLTKVKLDLPFTPSVAMQWRIAKKYWHKGYVVEAMKKVFILGLEKMKLDDIVAFVPAIDMRSQNIMKKLKMTHNVSENFNHPNMTEENVLREHVLYRIEK